MDCRIASSVSSCVGFFNSANFGVYSSRMHRQSGTERSRKRAREQHTGIKTGNFEVKHNKLCIMWNYYWCAIVICFWWEPHKWLYFISSLSPMCIFHVPKPPAAACYICVKYYCEQRMVIICSVSISWVLRHIHVPALFHFIHHVSRLPSAARLWHFNSVHRSVVCLHFHFFSLPPSNL